MKSDSGRRPQSRDGETRLGPKAARAARSASPKGYPNSCSTKAADAKVELVRKWITETEFFVSAVPDSETRAAIHTVVRLAEDALAALEVADTRQDTGASEAMLKAFQALADAVSETLDKDFGFWSSPSQAERRQKLYPAWHRARVLIDVARSKEPRHD